MCKTKIGISQEIYCPIFTIIFSLNTLRTLYMHTTKFDGILSLLLYFLPDPLYKLLLLHNLVCSFFNTIRAIHIFISIEPCTTSWSNYKAPTVNSSSAQGRCLWADFPFHDGILIGLILYKQSWHLKVQWSSPFMYRWYWFTHSLPTSFL